MISKFTVAAFDFDYTMTDRDSFLAFLFYTKGFWKTSYRLMTLTPAFLSFVFGKLSRQDIKQKILKVFLGGHGLEEIKKIGQQYADQQLDQYIRPEAFQRLQWHQSQGHRCLLISAAPEFYLVPWAKRHKFEAVLASQLKLSSNQIVTGELIGLNCWGPEKERRLLEYLGPKDNYQLYVYGDSRGDQQLLALADYPFYRTFH